MDELLEENKPNEPIEPVEPENPEEPVEPTEPKFELEDYFCKRIVEQYPDIQELAKSLIRKEKIRGITIDNDTAVEEIVKSINIINEVRRFDPTKEQPVEEKYYSLSMELAISSISKYGAEGQTSHSENGVGRGYENGSPYPKSLLQSIVPLAKASGGKKIG